MRYGEIFEERTRWLMVLFKRISIKIWVCLHFSQHTFYLNEIQPLWFFFLVNWNSIGQSKFLHFMSSSILKKKISKIKSSQLWITTSRVKQSLGPEQYGPLSMCWNVHQSWWHAISCHRILPYLHLCLLHEFGAEFCQLLWELDLQSLCVQHCGCTDTIITVPWQAVRLKYGLNSENPPKTCSQFVTFNKKQCQIEFIVMFTLCFRLWYIRYHCWFLPRNYHPSNANHTEECKIHIRQYKNMIIF
jgi:hypothetical protein